MSDQPETQPNRYNQLGGVAGIVMMICWLTLVPLMFVMATATANNHIRTAVVGAQVARWLLIIGLTSFVLTVAFYTLGSWRARR
jgi:uncharacterized membrane protein